MRGPGVYVFVYALTLPALVAVSGSAQVQEPGSDNPIAFVLKNSALGDSQTYIINPPGRLVRASAASECWRDPRWSSDGEHDCARLVPPANGTPDIYTKTAEAQTPVHRLADP